MGYAMASNIRQKIPSSSTLYINDINASACTRFKEQYSSHGPIEIVSTAREAAENARVLISIVPGGVDVKKVFLNEETGVVAAKKDEERIMLECSTIDVETTKEVGKKLKEGGWGTYIDTPVSVRTLHCYSLCRRTFTDFIIRAAFLQQRMALSPCSSVILRHPSPRQYRSA